MKEKVKNEIVSRGITEASKILILTMNMIEAENFITGNVIDEETGVAYELKFERKILNEDVRESGELFCQFNYDYKSCDKIKMFKCKYCELNNAK